MNTKKYVGKNLWKKRKKKTPTDIVRTNLLSIHRVMIRSLEIIQIIFQPFIYLKGHPFIS